jgi:hypothetical protein
LAERIEANGAVHEQRGQLPRRRFSLGVPAFGGELLNTVAKAS